MDRPSVSQQEVTALLARWSHGDDAALAQLTPLVYDELRRIAHRHMGGQRPDHTLQTTALVNEAYLRLADQTNPSWQNRAHFFAVAARAMRQIVVDYARRYAAAVTQLKRVIAMDEKFDTAYNWLVVALEMQGKYPEAFEWFMKGRARNFPASQTNQEITQAYQAAYQTSGWQGMLFEQIRRFEDQTDNIPYFQGAVLYAKVGNKDKAFECLEKSYQRREPWMSLLKVEPGLDSVRDDPRFDELVDRVGLK